ncbi:MAG: cysteine hydrolase family protein [Ktedonobacteraceae bacterium]
MQLNRDKKDATLVIIDIQVGMMEENLLAPQVLANIQVLLAQARSNDVPVIYVQHDGPKGHGLEVGSAPWQIHPAIAPQASDIVIHKRASDAFYQTDLQQELAKRGIKHLIVAGGQTEYCVDTTVRRATTLGYDITLAGDAHITFDYEQWSATQFIALYNEILNGFRTDTYTILVQPTSKITF